MADYDVRKLRCQTFKYASEPVSRIPCPDCHHREPLTIADDQPAVAAMLSYCSLCDGERYISKARALAVLPHVTAYVKELRGTIEELREAWQKV